MPASQPDDDTVDPAARLARRGDELRAERARLAESLAEIHRLRSQQSDDDEHDPEGETLSSRWSLTAGALQGVEAALAAWQRAADRLASGDYGLCAHCGRAIDPERLEARPDATLCIDCARRAEARRRS